MGSTAKLKLQHRRFDHILHIQRVVHSQGETVFSVTHILSPCVELGILSLSPYLPLCEEDISGFCECACDMWIMGRELSSKAGASFGIPDHTQQNNESGLVAGRPSR